MQTRARLRRASSVAPKQRLLSGLGAWLSKHPQLAARLLLALRSIPSARLRSASYRQVSRPLVEHVNTRLETRIVTGVRVQVDTSDVMGRLLAASGIWEPHVTAAFHSLLGPGDVCVDVGANIGYYTLLASTLVGPTGHVYAVEPASDTYAQLRSNIDLNEVSNVTALQVAAGRDEGRALLDESALDSGRALIRHWQSEGPPGAEGPLEEETVRLVPVSSIVPRSDIPRLKLVKIDVEGFELEVMRGLSAVFDAGARPAVLIEVHVAKAAETGAFMESFCRTYELKPYLLVDDDTLDRWVPRTEAPIELAFPLTFTPPPAKHLNCLLR